MTDAGAPRQTTKLMCMKHDPGAICDFRHASKTEQVVSQKFVCSQCEAEYFVQSVDPPAFVPVDEVEHVPSHHRR